MPGTLFEIGEDLLSLDALLEENGGDISDPAVDAAVTTWFEQLAADEGKKLDGYCGLIRQLEGEAAIAKAEAEQYRQMASARENRVKWLKLRLKRHLESTGRTKATSATGRAVSIQNNGGPQPISLSAGVTSDDLANEFVKVTREIDINAIRAALLDGASLPFATLAERETHLRIK